MARWLGSDRRSPACFIRRWRVVPATRLAAGLLGRQRTLQHYLQADPTKAVNAFLDELVLFGIGASWGGFESLAIPLIVANSQRDPMGPEGPTVRLHIGLENVDDLISDLKRGSARGSLLAVQVIPSLIWCSQSEFRPCIFKQEPQFF